MKKHRKQVAALAVGTLLLLISVFGAYKAVQAFNKVIWDELRGIQLVANNTRQVIEKSEESFDYETICKEFSRSINSNLNVLDHISDSFSVYKRYELSNLKYFTQKILLENDLQMQERNLKVICEIAVEMDSIVKTIETSMSRYNFVTDPKKIADQLANVESLCNVY